MRSSGRAARKAALTLCMVLVAGASAGCTQVAQLRGVAGGQVTAVRAATNDVLVDADVQVDVAPVCTGEEPEFVCRGTTVDGAEILSRAEVLAEYGETTDEWGAYVPADVSLVVTVGGQEIFNGRVEDVMVSNGQVTQ